MVFSESPVSLRPSLQPDETLGSWLTRIALANGLSPSEFYPIVLPGGRLYRTDLDRLACDDLVRNLAAYAGAEEAEVAAATFRRWAGLLFEADDGRRKLTWLPWVGTAGGRTSFGQQACPLCLVEDSHPYFRMTWRLGFVTACPRHGILLIDRCPACGEPLQPLFLPPPNGRDRLIGCWKCGADYRRAPKVSVLDPGAVEREGGWRKIAREGWAMLGDYGPQYSLAWFPILWRVYRLLATGRFAFPLRTGVADRNRAMPRPENLPMVKEVERLNPRCRQALLSMADELLRDWPRVFVEACREVGIASRILIKDHADAPFAYRDPVVRHLSQPMRTMGADETKAVTRLLEGEGRIPTLKNLLAVSGVKAGAFADAAPARPVRPYGTHRYWKLDGVSAEVRAAAKAAAHRAGEKVGPWVEQVLRQKLARERRAHHIPK
ncbi:TniQ family protein [Oleispirillum naphthae]|uniref:TniQ family protein n=1 Tax=Oleispirillum naphthae TaxID=2838853 RepID=UPI00308251FE